MQDLKEDAPIPIKVIPTSTLITKSWIGAVGRLAFWFFVLPSPKTVASGVSTTDSPLWSIAKFVLAALFACLFIYTLSKKKTWQAWNVLKEFRLTILLQAILLLLVTVGAGAVLRTALPVLDRSWLYGTSLNAGQAGNIIILPFKLAYLGVPLILLFAASIPHFAQSEEDQYRAKTRNWAHAVPRSLRFGLAHCLMGVPLFVALALSIGGLWFSYQYFKGGVARSTLHHATYNLLIVGLMLILVALHRF